jgi:hypothetical protein
MAKATKEKVPVLPRSQEVRETIRAVESGLKLLRGLAVAIERAEESATVAVVEEPDAKAKA